MVFSISGRIAVYMFCFILCSSSSFLPSLVGNSISALSRPSLNVFMNPIWMSISHSPSNPPSAHPTTNLVSSPSAYAHLSLTHFLQAHFRPRGRPTTHVLTQERSGIKEEDVNE